MRVRFLKDFDYRPIPQVLMSYPSGWVGTVKRECGEQAVSEGKAVALKGRDEESEKT